MRCVICKQADVEPGTATVTLERDGMTLVVKHVAARVCPNCGEEYVNEDAAARLMETVEQAARSGVQVDVREYAVA
jgi:YgiT-type zinc finger domain-containing protein